ncbi:hypothetical protein DEM26_01980 [Thioclava sp. NG1]|uniref:zinc-ribbon domain-containing protein n=1 Tax=Thioclava sp. NG1 TaxID=2182426 RepID=UPI000D61C025|nr:zinc-ribbon domain-containing protein [Thioclava sp. NG1]PWE51753.1 hypothetical protein DEM26_01980 [Thioclava sp. NG1]
MRLVCPNCGAQYEVDDAVIPDGGRDVQCSNCGHGWFQPSKDMLSADSDPTGPAAPPAGWDPDPDTETASEPETSRAETEAPVASKATEEPSEPAPMPEPEQQPSHDTATHLPEPEPVVTQQSDDDTDAAVAAMVAAPEAEEDDEDEPGLGPAPRVGAKPRKPLDDGLLSILREEAEREAAQRRAEGSSELQTQEELNLEERETSEDAERAAEAAAADLARRRKRAQDFSDLRDPDAEREEDRVADLLGEDDEDLQTIRGRERLPDIDEINSTLTATSDREGDSVAEFSPEMARRRRSGFSRGFIFVMAVTAVLALLYAFAPDIAAKVPALKSPLTQYVVAVDEGRIWLDDQLQILTHRLSPETASDGFTE